MNISTGSRMILTIVAVLAVTSLAFQAPAAYVPGAVNLVGVWDRLNPGSPPEHEVLRCGGNEQLSCIYDKHPEPLLNFLNPPDSTLGFFRGQDVTANWACPAWYPSEVCSHIAFVASGVGTYNRPDGSQLVAEQELIVAQVGGQSVLYMYWGNWGVACPWFRTFEEALAANPFPLPFNGTDAPVPDCLVAQ